MQKRNTPQWSIRQSDQLTRLTLAYKTNQKKSKASLNENPNNRDLEGAVSILSLYYYELCAFCIIISFTLIKYRFVWKICFERLLFLKLFCTIICNHYLFFLML